MSHRHKRVLNKPCQSTLQAVFKELGTQLVQIDSINVANQDRCKRRDMSRRLRSKKRLSNNVPDFFKTFTWEDIRTLMKVDGPKAHQCILNLGTGPTLPHSEMGDRDIEELQDFQELLSRERPLASLDFREAALRQP